MTTEDKIAEAVMMESEVERRSIACELLDPIPNKFSSEEPKKSPGTQDLPAEITQLHAEDVHSSCDFAESTQADRKDIDRTSEGKKFLESSSETAIFMAEDSKQLQRAETLETGDRTTDEEKHFQEEKSDKDYDTGDVISAVSRVAKMVETNSNIIEEQTTEEVLDQNVDTACGPKVDCTDNVANMDPTFVPKKVGENIFDVESEVSEKLLDLPAEQVAPQPLDICKQPENEKVEIHKIIQNGARDASIAAVAASSVTPNDDTKISDEGDKKPDESSTTESADMTMKQENGMDTVELKETTSTESQDPTGLSAETEHVMPAGENEEYKSNSTGSAVIIEPAAHSSHQIDEGVALKMDVEEANDLTQETIIQVVQNALAEDEDGMDRKENLDSSSAKHEESMQRDYSNLFSTEASEGETNDSGYLTGEVVMDVSGQGITDAKDHIAEEISSVKAEAEGSFSHQSPLGNEQPEINTEVLQKAVSCIKEEAHSKNCEGGFTQKVDEDKSVDNRPNDEEIQENSPPNPEGDEQRTEAADLEVECEKVTGEWEACKPNETKTEDGSEACKNTEFQDAGHPSREGHDPEDVAIETATSGDIYSTESVKDEILQQTFEPELEEETAPTCRAEHDSWCGEKEKATQVDENEEPKAKPCNTTDLTEETIRTSPAENFDSTQKENECEIKLSKEFEQAGSDRSLEDEAPQDNERPEMSLHIPPEEMTREVEGEEKGTSVAILADNSSTVLDKVIEKALTPEKDSEETVNKNEGAKEFKRSLNEITEPTEAESTNSPKMDGTIICHEELSAEGNNEDKVKPEQNETNKIYEQMGISSTAEGQEDLILLKANKETGESTVQDLIEEDPIQDGHDHEDVATDIAASGDIYSTESVTDEILQPTLEPEIVLETASTCRAEHDSCCGEKEEATEVDGNEELKAKPCNTTDLTEETIRTSPAENFDSTQKENECEIKLSKEFEQAGSDRSLEDEAPQDNERPEMSLHIPPEEMTREVEGEEKGTSVAILADNSSTVLDKVIEKALTPEKDSEETVNKNEGAKEFKRSLNEITEPTEAESTNSPKMDGTIICHEELSAEGNNEDKVKPEQNETNKIYEQMGISSTAEGQEDLILLKANKETGESTVQDLIEEDPIQDGHDHEDVATDIAASGDIYSTESVTDEILQPTLEPEIVLETASTCRAEHDSCCGEKEEATEVDGNEELKAKSCNTTELTEETIRTSPAENSNTTKEENECEIKLSEESEPAGADRSLEDDAPPPTHGDMTREVEGEEKATSVVILADNSSVTGLDKVIEEASTPEKDSEETVNKNEGAKEFKRSLNEIPEPTEADSTNSQKTDGTILCREELSAEGNNEDNVKQEKNETNTSYEQMGISSTTEGQEGLILLKANKETGESTVPDLIKGDPIQHGHDPEDVATDIAASAPICRAEHDSCGGEKEEATEVDENEELKAKSCNTTDLTEETIRTSPAENSNTTQKENECEIKFSEESEPAGADRSLEDEAPQDNESSEMSLQIPPPTHGQMTQEVEGEEKGTSVAIFADNSSVPGLDKVIGEALTPEKDSEETVNKNEGENEFKRSLNEIPELTEADSTNGPKMAGTILCHEELSAEGNNEANKIYEQMVRSSTIEGPEETILLKANKETGESTVTDLIEKDPIQHGHDPEDVATDITASGDIYNAECVTDKILQLTFEPEIVLETAPTCRAEHDSCCGEKEQATEVDQNEELEAKSCNTTDLTEETIRTSPAENSDTTTEKNECEIKLSEESKPAGADRSLEEDVPQDNESSEMSLQIPPLTHGEMTQEVEGEEKGTSVVILADNSSITGLDKVLEEASMPEKDSEETVNKNEGANEFKRSLNEIPEPTEADGSKSSKTDGTIVCHEELSAEGNNEDNVQHDQNETKKIYEQMGRSSTTECQENLILLKANKENGESTVPDLIKEDPIQHGHDPEDVATDIAASGDIYHTESVTDEILQPTFEPEIALETAPTCIAEHDSSCGEKEQATEVDQNEELKAKSCNTMDLTEETIRTSPAENSDTTQKENECEIKLSEESEPAGADRSLEDDAPQDNESSELSLQIPLPTHGEMTREVEGEEKGKSVVILSDNSSITGQDKVIEEASTPEKDSEETVNKNEVANEFKRSLNEITEPTEADSTNRPNTDGTILCHEESSAEGKNEDNAKHEQNEINEIYEQAARSSTTESPEETILLKANEETGESTVTDLIEKDHIQHGHDPEDVATDIAASGDIYSTESVTDEILQPTFEPEIVLETAPECRAEHDSCCEENEQATEVDQNEELEAKSCNTTDLTEETIRTSPAENSYTTREENKCEIKLSKESEPAGADRSLEEDAPQDNRSSEMSLQIPLPTHGEMTREVEGEEKGTPVVILADNSSVTGLDKVIEEASTPEKDSEETVNKNEGANEFKRSLNEIPEPTETDNTKSPRTDGVIVCHEELSAEGNNEKVKHEQSETNKIYEQMGISSTTECQEKLILLKANEEAGESTVPDLIKEDPIQHGIVLETSPTCRAEHDSRFGEKEQTTEVDQNEEIKGKSCNTMDLTEETIRTSPAENSNNTQEENECEIKLSEEPEPAGADRSLEDDATQDNESSEMSLQADNSIITELDKVIGEPMTPEKDSEETMNKNEGANALKRLLNEIPEPSEADSTNSPKMDGTIVCHEELSAEGNNEDNVKHKQNETNKIYEQMGRSSTTEDPEEIILLKANTETGESAGPDLIEEDPIQERTPEAIAHGEDNVMGCQIDPSTEEAMDYSKNITEETNAARDFEVHAEGISEGRPSKDDREEENNKEAHMQLVTFTSCEKTDDCEQEEDAKSKLSPAVDEQEIENQKSKFMSDEISLKEEGKDGKDFTEQVEVACSIEDTANTEKDNTETCHTIQSTSIDECSEKEMLPKEHDEYYQSDSPCAPPETNSEVNGAAERSEVPSANSSQAAQVSEIEDGIPAKDNEPEAKNHAGSTDIVSGVYELPTSAKQERRLENTDSNVKEDDLTDSGQEKGDFPASIDAIKESTESEILDKEPKDSKDLGTTEKPAADTLQGSLCSVPKTEAGEEEFEASAEHEGLDKNERHLSGTHSTEGVLMPQEDESTKTVSESEEVETAKGSAQKEVSEDIHIPPEAHFADLNIAEGIYISATNGTGETENQIQVDRHNAISDERSVYTHLEMKEIEGETHDEALKHQESFAPEADIKNRTLEEKVSTENAKDNLKEDYVPDKTAFHSEVSTPITEEMGAADMMSTQNLKTMGFTEQTETMNMEIEEHLRSERETCNAGEVEEEVQNRDKEDAVGLDITPIETTKEDIIKEPDTGINRDIAASEIGQEEVRPPKEQLDDRPNMASGICSDMGPPERPETDHGEEIDGTKYDEISTNLLPKSSESDSKSAEREITVVENPITTEEEIELPSDKKDETRASDAEESTETDNCTSIEYTDAEETEKLEEISERLATSSTQNGEAAKDGSAPDQTILRESTLELLTAASVSLLEEKENGPKTTDEKIKDDKEEEVEMQLNESLQSSSGTVQTEEAYFDKKETNKDGVSKIESEDSEGEKDTPNGQKDDCTHGEEVLKVETQEKESKTTNPDSPEVNDTTAEVSVITEEESSIVSSKSKNVHELVPDVQTNESLTRLEDVDLKGMKAEATIADVEPDQKHEDAIRAINMSQNVITDEAVLHGQLKTEETHNEEELETGEGDKKLLLESCKTADFDLKGMEVEATITDVEPDQKRKDAIEAIDMSQNVIANEVVLHGQLKTEETQIEEELETGEGDKKLLLESSKIAEIKDFVPVQENSQARDQAEQAQAGNADNEKIQISKIENDDESISTSKTADAAEDIEKEVVKDTATLDHFNDLTTAAVETAEIGIPKKEASSGVFNENAHEVKSDVQEHGSSIKLEHDEMKGMKVEAVTADVKPEEKCEDAIEANDMSQNGINNEGVPDEYTKSEETQKGEQREDGEDNIKISEKKDYFGPILAEDTEGIDQDEQAQAGNADKEQISDKLKDSTSVSKTEDSTKDFDENIKRTDTLDELNATTIAAVETAAEISIPREEALGVLFTKGENMHEVISDIQTNESSIGSRGVEMNAMRVKAVTADVKPAEKCEDGIEEIDLLQNAMINEGMTDEPMKAPLLESCNISEISEKKDFGKALAEVTEATDQIELAKAGHADHEEIQTSESKIHDRLKDSVSVSKADDATKDVEKETITEAGTTDEFNDKNFIAVPETTESKIPTEEACGFVLSKSADAHEVVLDVQADKSSKGSEDDETNGTQVEAVIADVKPEEKREDAIEANDMARNAIASEGVLDIHTKAGGEENETREGDNASLLGSCKINEKKELGPVVAEGTEATDQVEGAESENGDNEEIQTSKSKTDDKIDDSVLVWRTADAIKDVGKKIIEEADALDELKATTTAAAETEITMREPQEEETPVGTSTVPPDSGIVQNSNADDFERIGMVSELSHDSNSAQDETIDEADKTSKNEKVGLDENEAESEGAAHRVTVSKIGQGKTVFREETTADQTLSEKKQHSLVQTPMFALLPGGGEENLEKVEIIEENDEVAGEMELKENLELSSFAERTHTECLERGEPRDSRITELETSANESTQDTNEDEKEQNTHGEALKTAPEGKEKETEFSDSPLSSIQNKELSGPYEKASDVIFKTSKTAGVDMSEVQTVETLEESGGGEIKDVNLEAVAISEPAEQSEDAIIADNVKQEMQNEQEKANGSEEINEQETMKDVDSRETHGTTTGNGIINQDMHTGSISAGQTTHCDEKTNAEKPEIEKNLASKSESYAPVELDEENILNGGGIYIEQTKDKLHDFEVTKGIKEEAGSCFNKTDTAAMTSLRTETGTLAIQQDDEPVEASPANLEGPSPEATEPGLILSSKSIDKENLEETSSTSVCQLSDTEKGNTTIQSPHVSESGTDVVGENESLLFLVEKGGEAATMDENFGEKSLDGEMGQSNENIISTDVTEVCCKEADSIKHADDEFEIQANQVTKDTSGEEDKEGSNQVENLKLDLPEEESERRSVSAASADLGNMGTLAVKVFDIPFDTTDGTEPRGEVSEIQAHEISAACEAIKITDSKKAADDLEPKKRRDIAIEAADTLKDEILHEEVFIGPEDAHERENLMKEHQVEENRDPNETVAPGNRAICEEADSNAVSKEHTEASYLTEKTKRGNLDVEEIPNSKCDARIQEVLHQEKTQEEENFGSNAPIEHATKDSEELTKELDSCYDKVDTAPKTSSTSTPSSCPKEEKPVDDSGTGFDKELPKEVEIENSRLDGRFETQLEEEHLATDNENVEREIVTAENPEADGLGRITIASEAVLGSKDPGMDIIDAREETTAEELDVSESRSHCLELVHEAAATSDQNTSAKELEVQIQTAVSALLQEEHKDVRKRDTQNVQATETVLFSSAAEAKEEIWQKEIRQFKPPKVQSRGSETIQDDLTEKYNECSSTQDDGLEPETQNETKCTDFPSDSEKLVGLTSATESHEQGVCDDLVKSASQVKLQKDFNEPKDTGVEENQVHALARDLRAEEKGEETSKANETSQDENAEGQTFEELEDIDSRPINQEITKASCEEDELHCEKIVEGKMHDTFLSEANELQFQQDKSKHSAVDKDIAPKEFNMVHVERETVDKNFIDEAKENITSEGVTESDFKDQHSKANSGSSTTDATAICNEESGMEKTQKGDDLDLEEARETNRVLEQKEYTSIAVPEMPVSGEACLSTTADVTLTEGDEDRLPAGKERIVETIQYSKASNVDLGDPSKADLELKGIEYGGERTCSFDAKTSQEELSEDTSVVSLTDLLNKIPEGNSPTTEPSSKERRPTDESDSVPHEEVKRDEDRDENEEDEHERTEPESDAPVMVEASKDIEIKVLQKKSHNILSGVGSKFKHSISKVKKAITGKSSHSKAHSPK
ncbi:hypothetical protein BT93_B0467 [Corymbia citriodora subsp. variegata]|nr:hypothetical protein BT93_B0467 [Corymbia citriodora subsp. variegata]